jgi:hypothetical protein
MMQKSATFTTILRVKKCHFHYDMQKKTFFFRNFLLKYIIKMTKTSQE